MEVKTLITIILLCQNKTKPLGRIRFKRNIYRKSITKFSSYYWYENKLKESIFYKLENDNRKINQQNKIEIMANKEKLKLLIQ